MKRSISLGVIALAVSAAGVSPAPAASGFDARSHEPVVLNGSQLFGLGVVGSHLQGVPVEDIAVHSWTGSEWTRIASQVDERRDVVLAGCGFFKAYSGSDVQNTYDYTGSETNGLDADDEVVFMLRDTGKQAPSGSLPPGATSRTEVTLTDPLTQETAYAYVTKGSSLPEAAPYTAYASDDADNSADIPCNKASGYNRNDTIGTAGYQMHFDSRWGLDSIRVRTGDDAADPLSTDGLGPDVIDRWKGRAYAGDGSSQTEWYWSEHSTMLGTIAGPVRVIRATNGAASGTNVTRTIIAYADTFRQEFVLHLHPMPPEGFYGYWDMDCSQGPMTFYNSLNPTGVSVDGVPDPVGDARDAISHQYPLFLSPRTPLVMDPVSYWEQISSPNGGWVARWTQPKPVRGLTSGYYRDDHNYNDRTGSLPAAKQGACGNFGAHAHLADDSDGAGPTGSAGLSPLIENIIRVEHRVFDFDAPNVGAEFDEQQANPLVVTTQDQ